MATTDKDKDDKSSAFDHEAEAENMRRMGGDDDDDTVVIDEDEDDPADRTIEDDPGGETEGEGEDGDTTDDADDKDKGKQAKGEKLSPKLQARIDRLTARAASAEERAAELESTAGDATDRLAFAQRSGAITAKAGVEGEIAAVEKGLEDAIEAGDTKAQVKLQKQLAVATNKLDRVENWLARNPEPKPGERREPSGQQQQREKTGRDRFVPAARPWYDQHKAWFDDPKSTAERAVVAAIDKELGNENFDPDSDDWYDEMNKRLFAKMPHLKPKSNGGQQQQRRQQGRQRVAGVDRDSGGDTPRDQGSRTELSNDDKRLMRTFRLDPSNDKHVKEFYRQRKSMAR